MNKIMKVLLILLCFLIVFVVITNLLQCLDETLSLEDISVLRVNRPRTFSIQTSGAYRAYKDYNVNITTEEMCFKCDSSVTYKCFCFLISLAIAVVPIRTISRYAMKLEKQLFVKLEHLRAILKAISVGVITTDSQKKITYMNNSAGEMCGWCPETAIGKPIDDIVRFETSKEVDRDDQNLNALDFDLQDLNAIQSSEEYASVLHNEGKFLDVQLITSPLPLRDGTFGTVTLLMDVSSARAQVRELSHRAAHDALTGLPNRDSFERYLRNAAMKEGAHAIVYVDLDGFKAVNDTSGHAAGDALLKQVAQLIKTQIRHSDFVARLGGDEFGLILFNCGLQQAKALMNLLVKQIDEYQFCWEGEVLRFGASVGITSFRSYEDVGVLLGEADAACYTAKRRGKGQVCIYT